MRNSKSEPLLALGLVALCGCDALRVPVPEDPDTPFRASFTGFVGTGIATRVTIARPLDDPSERRLDLPWFDENASRISFQWRHSSGAQRTERTFFNRTSGLSGNAGMSGDKGESIERLSGRLRWNASAPFAVGSEVMVTDSFDVRPQPGAKVRFQRDGVRGRLDLRWPRLAAAPKELLWRWAEIPDSLVSLLADWRAISRARGDAAARILMWDSTSLPHAYRWMDPDTSVVRRVLEGEVAQTVFAPGDSIWLPYDRSSYLLANLDTLHLGPVLLDLSDRVHGKVAELLVPGFSQATTQPFAIASVVGYEWRNTTMTWSASYPLRVVVQVAGTCPAYQEWRHFGSTGRSRRPVGNVAPFDGYLCELFPDTLSFPRGRLIPPPTDTSTSNGSNAMPTKTVNIQPVRP